jgi:hypothetical protein
MKLEIIKGDTLVTKQRDEATGFAEAKSCENDAVNEANKKIAAKMQ